MATILSPQNGCFPICGISVPLVLIACTVLRCLAKITVIYPPFCGCCGRSIGLTTSYPEAQADTLPFKGNILFDLSFLRPCTPCSWSACPSLGISLSSCSVSLVSKQLYVFALLNKLIFFFQIWQPFKITLSIPFHASLFPMFVLYILVLESSL